jgi:hypothetical protein
LWGIVDLLTFPTQTLTFLDWTDYYLTGTGGLTSTKPTTNPRLILRVYANRVAQVVPSSGGSITPSDLVVVSGGNILSAAVGSWPQVNGIKPRTSGTLSTVPTLAPVTSNQNYPDGLGFGVLQSVSGAQSTVWVANGNVLSLTGIYPQIPISSGSSVLCVKKVVVPVTAGGSATVYMPFTV